MQTQREQHRDIGREGKYGGDWPASFSDGFEEENYEGQQPPVGDYLIEVSVKNNRIVEYMNQFGYVSVNAFCREHNMSPVVVGEFINLKKSPINKLGTWTLTAIHLSNALCCEPDDLWSDVQMLAPVFSNLRSVAVAEEIMFREKDYSQETYVLVEERREAIELALNRLTMIEADVIRMSYGLAPYKRDHTLEEVGKKYGVTRERIRQIEVLALRALRHKKSTDILTDFS